MSQKSIQTSSSKSSSSFRAVIKSNIMEVLKNVQTDIVAVVESIDRIKGTVNVQPLIKTVWSINPLMGKSEWHYPLIQDVPVKRISAHRGAAMISMPVKVGDVGILTFCARDTETYLSGEGTIVVNSDNINNLSVDGKPFKLCWDGEIFTEISNTYPIPEDNIVIHNGDLLAVLQPDGNMIVNGCTITPNGNVITAAGVDLNQLRKDFDEHIHRLDGKPTTTWEKG